MPVVITYRATLEVALDEGRFVAVADARRIPFFQININKPEWVETLGRFDADLAVAMFWLHTIVREPIKTARLGFVNCHRGLLPKYRDNACSNWAILNDESEIGLTTHLMTPGKLDSGPILEQRRVPIYLDTYIGDLITQIVDIGAELVLNSAEVLRTGTLTPVPQDPAKASFCYPCSPVMGR